MTEEKDEYKCPLSPVDRRLEDAHRHWHEAEKGYFDPDTFRRAIQATIQTLRTVTFILQSNKRLFSSFDTWYESWRTKFRSDPLMRWMVDARNKIEKQGDLETHSFIRAEILASYYENGPSVEIEAHLFQSPEELLKNIPTQELRDHVFKDGILRIQRKWVENTLPNYELLEAVAVAYGKISEMVADAHKELKLPLPSTIAGDTDYTHGKESRGGRLPCMIGHSDIRTQNVWLATGQAIEVGQKTVKFDKADTEHVRTRYGFTADTAIPPSVPGAEDLLKTLFTTARTMITVDGHHNTIAFLLNGGRPISVQSLAIQEHGEKYLVMRTLANEVIKLGADGVIVIAEAWMARYDPKTPYRRAADAPERREYLTATLVTKYGPPLHLQALIQRKGESVALADTEITRNQSHVAFVPIYAAWGREVPPSWMQPLHSRDAVSGDEKEP
ncbi:hypothetical protein [Pseudomonas putida]